MDIREWFDNQTGELNRRVDTHAHKGINVERFSSDGVPSPSPGGDPHLRHGGERAVLRAVPGLHPGAPDPGAAVQRPEDPEHEEPQPRG